MEANTHLFVLKTKEENLLKDGQEGGLSTYASLLVFALHISWVERDFTSACKSRSCVRCA